MKLLLLLVALLCATTCTAQTTYNPGMNVDIEDWLVYNIKDIIVPELMEEFKQIDIPDQGVSHEHYELKVYNMETDIVPLTKDQMEIVTNQTENSLTISISNFQMSFSGNAYARALFIHMHGEAVLQALLRNISITITPKLRADGDLNALDYDIKNIKIDFKAGDIKFTKLTLGDLPSWLLASLTNAFVETFEFVYHEFEQTLDGLVVKLLDKYRVSIPDAIVIPNTPFSASVSFPNVPQLKDDRIEVPFDGTVFLTAEGYHPSATNKSEIPSYDSDDQNNIQVFLHEYVLNTALNALKKAGSAFRVDADVLSRFQLPVDIMLTKWFSHLFPKLLCTYDENAKMAIDVSVDPNLESSLHFSADKLHGEFSPMFKFYANDDLAFTLSFRAVLDVELHFAVEDKTSTVHGVLNTVDLADINFVAGSVPSTDIPDIVNKFKNVAEVAVTNTVNNMLATGVTIPIIQVIQEAFEVDLDSINLALKDQYSKATFTVDITQMDALVAAFVKLGYKL